MDPRYIIDYILFIGKTKNVLFLLSCPLVVEHPLCLMRVFPHGKICNSEANKMRINCKAEMRINCKAVWFSCFFPPGPIIHKLNAEVPDSFVYRQHQIAEMFITQLDIGNTIFFKVNKNWKLHQVLSGYTIHLQAVYGFVVAIKSGQIIATSHDLTPNGGLVREFPLFQGNLGWWNIIIWPDKIWECPFFWSP